MPRRLSSFAALVLATLVLAFRVYEINKPAPRVVLAPRTEHLLYLDSLRRELVAFAEQYGRPVFLTDTTPPVNGHGRIQLARLRQALFDPRVLYGYTDKGFAMDWRGDPKPRVPRVERVMTFAEFSRFLQAHSRTPIGGEWPMSAAEYARLRRLWITPQWPDPPARRANRRPAAGVPPHGDAYSIIASNQNP
jgi:hypothetical protein